MGTFDMEQIQKETDFVFRGTVLDRKEYHISWYDDNMEQWGPYHKSVIEERIEEEYYGTSPVEGDTIKIYYAYPVSADMDGNFHIEDGEEYVFVTKALDEEFVRKQKETAHGSKYEQEKHADVYIGDTCYDVMAVEEGNVIFYKEYFSGNETVEAKYLPEEKLATDKMVSEYILKNWFAALALEDFEEAIAKIF